LLSRLLGLNETQEGILNIAFKVADEKQLLLIDIKDLRAMLNFVGDNATELRREYGNISKQSIGAILRGLLVIEEQGGDLFFGEPMFDIQDLLKTDAAGRGYVNILMANRLFMSPKLYSTFLLWFLSELYEQLPEVGDLEKPKIVFFFDEAHVLFQDVPDVVEEKIELIVRLIRSKGVGVYFVTQNPTDLPNAILSQLGNKIQHALRAFTPKEQKTVKAVAETFRQLDGEEWDKKLTELKVGEALVSFLDPEGIPSYVQQVMIYPPESKMGILDPLVKEEKINRSLLYYKYSEAIDRESSYEQLQRLSEIKAIELEENEELAARDREKAEQLKQLEKERQKEQTQQKRSSSSRDTTMDRFTKNLMSQVGREVGRVISRGILGILKK
jgi:DNA helicase HerA-like ATPase